MRIQIKHKISGAVLFSCKAGSMKIAVGMAVKASADLSYANLSYANLRSADLRSANLSHADLDYSAWPLWCGSKKVKVDAKIAAQIAAHFCVLDCEDKNYLKAKKAIMKFALTSHRAVDLGLKA